MKKTFKIRHIKISPIIGIGCWKDDYSNALPDGGYCWNIILICFRILIGKIYYTTNDTPKKDDYEFDFGDVLKTK